jgi:hypothetical protein
VEVKIKGKTWKIKTVDDLHVSGVPSFGSCAPGLREIELDRGQTAGERMNTLVHELAHAVDFDKSHKKINALAEAVTETLLKDGWVRL